MTTESKTWSSAQNQRTCFTLTASLVVGLRCRENKDQTARKFGASKPGSSIPALAKRRQKQGSEEQESKMPLLAIRERVEDFTGNTSSKSDSRTKPCYTKSGEGLCDDPLSTKAPIRELF